LDGAHGTVVEPDASVRHRRRPADGADLAFSVEQAVLLDNWDLIGLRGTASESYRVDDLLVPEDISSPREDSSLRGEKGPLYAFPRHALYSVGIASVGLGIARGMLDAFVELTSRKTPRGTGRLGDNAVIQAELARSEARLGAARGYPLDSVTEIYPADRFHRPNRRDGPSAGAPRRLPYNNGRRRGRDWTYKAAVANAIFPGSHFERRFRDIHTLSQQIQSRDAHHETVGQVLLGTPPEVLFSREPPFPITL
jgi:alkylation response protein AidB-like acyl-CoA dehydrogenase